LRTVMARPQDVRMLVVYGYARLVGYDGNFDLHPDILRAVDVERGRVFTLHLRRGHKWSDGQPFTGRRFPYWWEDVTHNKQAQPRRLTGHDAEATASRLENSRSSTR